MFCSYYQLLQTLVYFFSSSLWLLCVNVSMSCNVFVSVLESPFPCNPGSLGPYRAAPDKVTLASPVLTTVICCSGGGGGSGGARGMQALQQLTWRLQHQQFTQDATVQDLSDITLPWQYM